MSFFFPQKFLRNKRVKKSSGSEIEPEEIFLDNLAKNREVELDISEKKFEVPLSNKVILRFYFGFLFLLLIFFSSTFYFQILKHEDFSLLAKRNTTRVFLDRSERGVIYDNQGRQLVFNQPSFDLICDKRNFPWTEKEKRLSILRKLSQIINEDAESLKQQIEESVSPEVLISENIVENLGSETLILLETNPLFSGKEENSVCRVEMNTVRDYASGPNLSHLIGYVGKINKEEVNNLENYSIADYIGKIGLEKSYEKVLRGTPGRWEIEKDALGQTLSEKSASEPEPGKGLVLWLDSELQEKISSELSYRLELTGSKAGIGIAIDPKTGGVLSLVSLPDFDNNLFSKGTDPESLKNLLIDERQPLFNRAISGEYLTGSTIKPFIASAALQEKIISPQKYIYDPGLIEVPHEYDPEITYTFLDWMPHGWVNIREAIAVSCNVYFYTIGGGFGDQKGLGVERIKKYLNLFGWGEKTGIDLPEESSGLIPDPTWKKETVGEGWYVGNTYHLSIGQGYLRITPLQVTAAFSAIANGGKLLQPQVVQKIIDGSINESKTVEEIKPKIIRENFIDSENLQIVREGMREAVTYGSSVVLNDLPVKAAAKTGTAETGREGYYHNWVTVFAPYDDPQIVITIMIENVPEGMVVVLPIAKEVLNWYFSR